jgi:hypothetical protein
MTISNDTLSRNEKKTTEHSFGNRWRAATSYYAVAMRPTSTLKFLNGYYYSSPRSEFIVLWGRRRHPARTVRSTICIDTFRTRVHVNICCITAHFKFSKSGASIVTQCPYHHIHVFLQIIISSARGTWNVTSGALKNIIRKLKVSSHGVNNQGR